MTMDRGIKARAQRVLGVLSRPAVAFTIILGSLSLGPVLLLVPSGRPGDDGGGWTVVIVGTIVVGLLALLVLAILNLIAGPDPEAEIIARNLGTDPMSEQLLHRWLARSRWYRTIGGMCGVVIALLSSSGDQTRIEMLLLLGTGGVLLGAALSEWHQAKPNRGTRIASIDVRTVDHYLDEANRRRSLALAGLNLVLLAIATLDLNLVGSLWALLGLSVLGATRLFQHRVASRARPQLPKHLRQADDLARHLAISRNLAMPANIVAAGILANGFGGGLPPRSGDGGIWLGLAFFFLALWWWWRNRRMGLTISTRLVPSDPGREPQTAAP